MNTHTLAVVALVLGITAQTLNVWTLVRKLLDVRLRRIEKRLGLAPAESDPDSITVADIVEIKLKPRPRA